MKKRIIVSIGGGIGNQMFMYAFGYAISQEQDCELCLDTSLPDNSVGRPYEMDAFKLVYGSRITYSRRSDLLSRAFINKVVQRRKIGLFTKMVKEKKPYCYDPNISNFARNTYFEGNWQSEKYFAIHRDKLIEIFSPCRKYSEDINALEDQMQKENSISVHIRRGDYVQIGCTLDMQYYDKAIGEIRNNVKDPVFYIFSDDLEFCKSYLRKYDRLRIIFPKYVSENHTIDDTYLMSKCKHNIIANSSYSWWGAWLNQNPDKSVVCPEVGIWKGDFYPDKWLKIKM